MNQLKSLAPLAAISQLFIVALAYAEGGPPSGALISIVIPIVLPVLALLSILLSRKTKGRWISIVSLINLVTIMLVLFTYLSIAIQGFAHSWLLHAGFLCGVFSLFSVPILLALQISLLALRAYKSKVAASSR